MNHSESSFWFSRHSKPLIFLILTLAALGVYLAFTIPVSVFPTTNFPRVLIAVDNGVMPIDQMMVTITRPLEEAVNSVPGLTEVRSITSRGEAEIDLFFDWNVDMFGYGPADRALGISNVSAAAALEPFGWRF